MFYTINKSITNIYDGQELRIVGNVSVFNDTDKTQLITQMPFSELGLYITFAECPHESKEAYNNYIENKALEAINKPEIQTKLDQVKIAYDLGIL